MASITQTGLATTLINPPIDVTYSTTITAIGTTTSGSVIAVTVPLTVVSSSTGSVASEALTVYETGAGTGNVAGGGSSLSISCGNGGTVCGQSLSQGTIVTLTATPAAGSSFGGWTGNCTTASANSCTVTMTNNQTIGALFNTP